MDLSKLFYVFLDLCQTRPSWSLTKISKFVEASALNQRCWMSQSIQCLGSVLPSQQQQQQDKSRGMKVHHIAEDGCKGHQADD